MNRAQREQYLREYQVQKEMGKPFFPYTMLKDGVMAAIVLFVIIGLAVLLGGGELQNKADPTTVTYTPRPDWYFYFLFEVLRVIKPPVLVPVATIGVPTIGMVLLVLMPFIDRNPERRPERRPIATTTGIVVIALMAYLTYLGAHGKAPDQIEQKPPTESHRRPGGPVRARPDGRQPVGLRRLPQVRRGRRHDRARPERHRPDAAADRDRPHARESDGTDAVVRRTCRPNKFDDLVFYLSNLK